MRDHGSVTKEGWAYVSQYEQWELPRDPSEHDRTKFRKRHLVLKGQRLDLGRKNGCVVDVGECQIGGDTLPSPFSFWLMKDDAKIYFMFTGDDEKEEWVAALLGDNNTTAMGTEKDFKKVMKIGQGTFGSVYKVISPATGRVYAMKHTYKKCEEKEKDILTSAAHPFIVQYYSSFSADGGGCCTMFEFLSGGDLATHQQDSETLFSSHKAQFYIAEIALAIGHLHSMGIIHRDLKAENVVIDGEGHVRLSDFGFATYLEDVGSFKKPPCGTLAYMAPEVFTAGGGKPADWWALGVLLFSMTTGCYPFLKQTVLETAKDIISSPLVFPPQPCLSPKLTSVQEALLCKDPAQRLSTLMDLQDHPWYEGFDWEACLEKRLPPPFVPSRCGRNTKYFRPCLSEGSASELAESDETASDDL